jgi:NADH:ubiquinone oxidoreductase subunit F (NADH-binding)
MKQHPSPQELHKQAVPVIRDLVRIQAQHYGMISIDSLIYAMVRHLSLTIAAVCEYGDDYREWINSLMDEFRNELEQKPEPVG